MTRLDRTIQGRFLALALAVLTALVLSGCGGGSESSADGGGEPAADGGGGEEKTLPYGLLVPLSGPAAAFGPPHRASVETAIERINSQGGIKVGEDTYKLELKVYDSAFDPTKGVSKAREAIGRDGVKFLAIDGGVVTTAVQPVAERESVVIFALAGGDKFLGEDHPLTFRYYYSIPDSLIAGLTILKPELPANPKLVNFYTDDDIARELAAEGGERAEALGFETSSVYVSRDATDFNSVLTKVLEEDPDVIDFGIMPPSQYAVAVKQARQLGYEGKFIFDDTLYLDTVVDAAGEDSVIGSVSVPYFGDFTSEEGEYWYANIESQQGGDKAQGWTALGYDAVLLFAAAVEEAQSVEPEAVADALREVSTDGVLGTVRYGGADKYGINQVFNIEYGVAKVNEAGELEKVGVVDVNQ